VRFRHSGFLDERRIGQLFLQDGTCPKSMKTCSVAVTVIEEDRIGAVSASTLSNRSIFFFFARVSMFVSSMTNEVFDGMIFVI